MDQSQQTAASYGIQAIPTLAVFADGEPVAVARGLQSAAALAKLVQQAADKRAAVS